MATYRITVIPGDGIGHEVMAEALKVLQAVEAAFPGLTFTCQEYPAGARCCQETGTDLPDETLAACKSRRRDTVRGRGPAGRAAPRRDRDPPPDQAPEALGPLCRGPADQAVRRGPARAGRRPAPSTTSSCERTPRVCLLRRPVGLGWASRWSWTTWSSRGPGRSGSSAGPSSLARKRNGAPADGVRRVTCVDKANVFQSMVFFRQIFYEVAKDFPECPGGARLRGRHDHVHGPAAASV